MSDEGFHEIQLNGKQLIFLCMTAALILVVAFLTGVLVGRGVRTQKDASVGGDPAAAPPPAAVELQPSQGSASPQAAAAPPITAIAPPTPTDEDLSYDSRLQGKPPAETLSPAGAAKAPAATSQADAKGSAKDTKSPAVKGADPVAAPPAPAPAAQAKTAEPDAVKANASLPGEPPGPGYYLKVVAYRDRAQAASVARRLSGKGYSAYVVPLTGRGMYSVRVGKYKTRREADTIRRRLEKEEQLKPLISH